MTPEEVPAELVERAAQAIFDDYVVRYPEDPPMSHAGPGQPVWRHMARHALAATMPKIEADALREIAVFLGTKNPPTIDGVDIVEWMLKTADYVEAL